MCSCFLFERRICYATQCRISHMTCCFRSFARTSCLWLQIRDELSSQIRVLEGELETEREYASVAKKEYDVEISNLIQKLESQRDAAADRQTELEEANQMLSEAQQDFDDTVAELNNELRLQV